MGKTHGEIKAVLEQFDTEEVREYFQTEIGITRNLGEALDFVLR